MPIEQVDVAQAVREIARLVGDVAAFGTATSGSSTTLVDTKNFTWPDNDEINGFYLGILAGNGIGEDVVVDDFNASNDTATAAFTATINSSTQYVLTKQFRLQNYLDAIASGIRRVIKNHLLPLDDVDGDIHQLITLGDILSSDGNGNGQMEVFSSGAAAVPDGWSKDGNTTVARESGTSNVHRGSYSLKVTSDGTNLAQVTQNIKHFDDFAGFKVTFQAWVKSDTTARTLIRVGDGVSTSVTATESVGADIWELLEAELELSDNPKELQVDLEISAGGAVNSFFDDVRLLSDGVVIWEYDLPSRLMWLSGVQLEVGGALADATRATGKGSYYPAMETRQYMIERGASPLIIFNRDYGSPPINTHVRLTGQVHPDIPTTQTPATAVAENIEVNIEYVKAYAKWYLLSSVPVTAHDDFWRLAIREARIDYQLAESELGNRPLPNSQAVRVL